jgi:hypothetical protein
MHSSRTFLVAVRPLLVLDPDEMCGSLCEMWWWSGGILEEGGSDARARHSGPLDSVFSSRSVALSKKKKEVGRRRPSKSNIL